MENINGHLNQIDDIQLALDNKNFDQVDFICKNIKKKWDAKDNFSLSQIAISIDKKADIYFKIYVEKNDEWLFCCYGNLSMNNLKLDTTNQKTITGIAKRLFKVENSKNHLMLIGNNRKYLLYNPDSSLVDIAFGRNQEMESANKIN
jgi:hypothetical protein